MGTNLKWLFLAIAAMVCVSLMGNSVLFGLQTKKWNHTVGHIVMVKKHHHGSVTSEEVYNTEVRYVYEIEGQQLSSNKLSAEPPLITEFFSYFSITYNPTIYESGKPVVVYFDPKNPSDSLLKPGVSLPAWIALVSSAAVLLVSLLFLYRSADGDGEPYKATISENTRLTN